MYWDQSLYRFLAGMFLYRGGSILAWIWMAFRKRFEAATHLITCFE
jgi:hypothetical protein